MNNVNKQSLNVQEEKLIALKSILPNLFNEDGTLDIKELELWSKNYPSTTSGKYEFNWAGKMSAKRNAYKPSRATLKPDKARSLDFDNTENMIIEGDNLEVLKLLQKSYSNKIKYIYIDPPYNTGNDFVYNDDFSEGKVAYWEQNGTTENGVKVDSNSESQGRYHSNWLNMMYPRLILARELLRDDGLIFISIDDKEVHNLRKTLDEIFGEENFVSQMVWKSKFGAGAKTNGVIDMHEYVLLYAKNFAKVKRISTPLSEKALSSYRHKDEKFNERGPYGTWPLQTKSMADRPNLVYPILHNGEEIWPDKQWLWSRERVLEAQSKNEVVFNKMSNGKWSVRFKGYLKDVDGNQKLGTPISVLNGFYTQDGTKELSTLFPNTKVFDFPKPSKLIEQLLAFNVETIEDNDDTDKIVLDFFAGSGSTAQAVMQYNYNSKRQLKFILIQLPEQIDNKDDYKTISSICIERVKRVSENIKTEKSEKLLNDSDSIDLGFKVFKLSSSLFPENQFTPDPEKSEEQNIEALNEYLEKVKSQLKFEFNEVELLYEVLLKDGFNLNFKSELLSEIKANKIYKVTDGDKEALVCLDDTIDNSTLKILEGMKEHRFICLERAVDTTKKWNLKSIFGQNLWVI